MPGGEDSDRGLAFNRVAVNRHGELAISGPRNDATRTLRDRIWVDFGSGVVEVAAENTAAPLGRTYAVLEPDSLHLNDGGRATFSAMLTGPSGPNDFQRITLDRDGTRTLKEVSGHAVQNSAQKPFLPSENGFNNSSEALYVGTLYNPGGSGILITRDDGTSRMVAAVNGVAPGLPTGTQFDFKGGQITSNAVLNSAGKVAFTANVKNGGTTEATAPTLWYGDSTSIELLARAGDAAPGAGSGVIFSDFHSLASNSRGDVVFYTTLAGEGIAASNSYALYAWSAGTDLRLIAREGMQIDVDPTSGVDLRTIRNGNYQALAMWTGTGGSDGMASSLSENGHVYLRVAFTDDSQAILSTVIPEPMNVLWMSGLTLMLARRRRS